MSKIESDRRYFGRLRHGRASLRRPPLSVFASVGGEARICPQDAHRKISPSGWVKKVPFRKSVGVGGTPSFTHQHLLHCCLIAAPIRW